LLLRIFIDLYCLTGISGTEIHLELCTMETFEP